MVAGQVDIKRDNYRILPEIRPQNRGETREAALLTIALPRNL